MKNEFIKIFSHPRSGTNFLGATLNENFYSDIDLSKAGGWGHWSCTQVFKKPVRYGKLFGNHKFPTGKITTPSVYIYRDGRDVALSVWRSSHFLNKEMASLTFSKFLRTNIDWSGSPSIKTNPCENIIQHWDRHVRKWSNFSKGKNNIDENLILVRYEDLVMNPERELCFIAEHFNIKINHEVKTIKELVGPSPNDGCISKWKEFYSDTNLNYFFKFVSKNNEFLFKEDK